MSIRIFLVVLLLIVGFFIGLYAKKLFEEINEKQQKQYEEIFY